MFLFVCLFVLYYPEKTKNLLFNGAKAVRGKIWTGEERCPDPQPSGPADSPACSQALLRGQTLIGHDGRLTRVSSAQGEPQLMAAVQTYLKQKTHDDNAILCQTKRLHPVLYSTSCIEWPR